MTPQRRHYGLDWLRIGAFGLLIVYHVAMVFSTWDWVIKSPVTYHELTAPMALLTPGRLPLLFAVSGFASRKLFAKSGDVRAFTESRNRRLLIPWGSAMVALIPPKCGQGARARLSRQPAPFLADRVEYHAGLWPCLSSWEHLWFVVYLWAYTLRAALLIVPAGMPNG